MICVILLLVSYLLLDPKNAVLSAANGLTLWYEHLLPSLLPFSILSYILIESDAIAVIVRLFRPLCRILPFSEDGIFVLLSGMLFGFPVGSRLSAQLLCRSAITKEEAEVLCVIANNMSPAFVVGYLITDTLGTPTNATANLAVGSLLLLYLPPFLCGVIALALRRNRRPILQKATKRPASGSQITFKIIDAGIMNGFETLTKLGGYIMLFSMLASLIAKLPVSDGLSAVLIGIVEITNGVRSLAGANLSPQILYAVAMALTSFGGLSGLAQTGAMIQETNLSLKKYCIGKILLALLTGLLAWFSLAYRM